MVRRTEPSGTPAGLMALGYTDLTWDRPVNLPRGHLTTTERMASAWLEPGSSRPWATGDPLDLDAVPCTDPLTGRTTDVATLLRERLRCDAVLVAQHGRLRAERYFGTMRPEDQHLVHSCSKTLFAGLFGLAVADGLLALTDPVARLVPELENASWDEVTWQHVLDMATGHATEEHYDDPASMYWRYAADVGYYGSGLGREPGTSSGGPRGVLGFAVAELTTRAHEPGSVFNYASYLTNLLPLAAGRAWARDPLEVLEERIFGRLGAEQPAIVNVDVQGRAIAEGQVSLTLRDFGRWAQLYATEGRADDGSQVLPQAWVREAFTRAPHRRAAFERGEYRDAMPGAEYHHQAWLRDPARDQLAMLGIHGQLAVVDLPSGVVLVCQSSHPEQVGPLAIAVIDELVTCVLAAAGD